MISNCNDCQFHSDRGCAVNPNYWQAFNHFQHAEDNLRTTIAPLVEACPDWQESEELQTQSVEVCLTLRAWKWIAGSGVFEEKLTPLVEKAREITGYIPPKDNVPF